MNREYIKWYSPGLGREMELLIFGDGGAPVLFYPTRTARFYDYENWNVIEAVRNKIESRQIQIVCVDSIDHESLYNDKGHPSYKMIRHLQYERYIMNEVLPLIRYKNSNPYLMTAGCSLGAYHALNTALKYPHIFRKTVGMSGRYDLTKKMGCFKDLFDGYRDENIYFNMPNYYVPNIQDENLLWHLKNMQILLAIGTEDWFYENNIEMSTTLEQKGIMNELNIWEGEAHKPEYWQKMVQLYF